MTMEKLSQSYKEESMEALTIFATGGLCIVCFLIGARTGQQVSKGETIQSPIPNPIQSYREHQEKKEVKREQDKIETIMRNIEAYDGTGNNQKDVPR